MGARLRLAGGSIKGARADLFEVSGVQESSSFAFSLLLSDKLLQVAEKLRA